MKKIIIIGLVVALVVSCSSESASNGNVTLKAAAVSSTGKTSLTSRVASTVVITDFKINIGNIKLETDVEDERFSNDPSHEDIKLTGPFLLDLLNPEQTLSQIITSVTVPDAKYEEIKFKFEKSTVAGEMLGRTFLIKGTVDGKEFVLWSGEEAQLEMDFEDASKDFTVKSSNITLFIKFRIDAILAKIVSLQSQGLLKDTDGDGVIEITTGDDDGHHDLGKLFKELLENETHLDDKD